MEKQELEAILGDGDDVLDLGPIEDYLHILATRPELSAMALVNCVARIEESGPILRALLARAAEGETLSDEEAQLAFRGLHILGGARDRHACQILLHLLRRPEWELDALLGDAVTETLARIAAGVFDGEVEALFDAIADRSVDQFARDALWGAATFLTWEGRIDRNLMKAFIERFYQQRLASDEDHAWVGWLEAIALLGLRSLAPLVHNAFREGRAPLDVLEPRHFEQDLAAAEHAPDDVGRFERNHLGYIEDVYGSLSWCHDEDSSIDQWEDAPVRRNDWPTDPTEPAINPWRHVGRNDSCPCGSGKKAKKCCLAS